MAAFYDIVTTDAALLSAVRNTLIAAGWQTTTNANPYSSTYYVYKSPGASNTCGVDWFIATWVDTTNHRVAIMPFEEFSDVATPQYRKFVPTASATPAGDGYHSQALQNLGSFTNTPAMIVLERSSATAGGAAVVVRATLDMFAAMSNTAQVARKGGICGPIEPFSWNTERPDLFLVYNPISGQPAGATYPPAASAAIGTGGLNTNCVAVAKDTIPGVLGTSTSWRAYIGTPGFFLETAGSVGTAALYADGDRDGWDQQQLLTWDGWIVQWSTNNTVPRIKLHGKMRDIVYCGGAWADVGALIYIDSTPYRCIGAGDSANQTRGIYVKWT